MKKLNSFVPEKTEKIATGRKNTICESDGQIWAYNISLEWE